MQFRKYLLNYLNPALINRFGTTTIVSIKQRRFLLLNLGTSKT